MSAMQETVFVGRDNAIRFVLAEDGTPLSEAFPALVPTKWELSVNGETVNSEAHPEAFSYNPVASILEMRIGGGLTTPCEYTPVTLIMYSAEFPNGLVWLHPTCTASELQLRVCNHS